jgi:hypothetical protein
VTDLNQGLAFQNPFELVHSKELRSCGGRIRKRFNRRRFGIDAKMLFPAVETRIEKPNQPIGPRDERGDVSAFGAVAVDARQGQVLFVVSAAMFARDDVFDLQLSDWRESLRQVAVFAAIGCSVTNELA